MQPETMIDTTTAVIGADASEDEEIMQLYMALSEANRQKVNELVEELLKGQRRLD